MVYEDCAEGISISRPRDFNRVSELRSRQQAASTELQPRALMQEPEQETLALRSQNSRIHIQRTLTERLKDDISLGSVLQLAKGYSLRNSLCFF